VFAAGAGPGSREWTLVRPGPLTDEPGTGAVRIDLEPFRGDVPRDDVAAVLDALLAEPRSAHPILCVSSGSAPVEQALEAVL
jgi:NAD(P)H-binding